MKSRFTLFGISFSFGQLIMFVLMLALLAVASWRPESLVALFLIKGGATMAIVFPGNCSGRLINVSASTGCTLTRASIVGLTPETFAALGLQETGYQKIYAKAREARMAGYIESNLVTLLMSRVKNMKGNLTTQKIGPNESVILPFFPLRQRRNINSNYWKITAGTPNANAGVGGVHPGAFDLTVTNNPSSLATTLVSLEQYFLPGKMLFVEYTLASSNVAYSLQYKIAAASTTGATTKVTVEPNVTSNGWGGYSAAQKLPFQIGGSGGGNAEAGTIAFLGVNSVSDFESWGGQDPAENNLSLLTYWYQTSRLVHEYTDEYLRALNAALDPNQTNSFQATFQQLPLSQQKVIQRAKYDRDRLNSAFFGQQIDENQAVETYTRLPKVTDPLQPGCVLEYKANALGFKTQLDACSRVLDHQGNPLNLDSLLSTLYLVKKARQADGSIGIDDEPVIDVMTDPVTAGQIRDIMISFYKAKYGANIDRFYNPNQKLEFENQVAFKYTTYQIPDELGGYVLAVFSSEFFRDRLAAASGSNRQRYVFVLDWSDVTLGIMGSNSVARRTNEADQVFMYTPKVNVKHVTLDSEQWAPILEDPNRHYMVQNFANACPVLTVSGCTV